MKSLFSTKSQKGPSTLPFKFAFISMEHLQEPVERSTGIEVYQWIQCIKGYGEVILNDRKYILEKDCGIFLHPNVPHQYYGLSDDFTVNFYGFEGYGVASVAGFTKEYFCNKFKSIFGITVVSYINNERIGHAVELLLQTPDKKVEEVARQCGFQNNSYFISVFKKNRGLSPAAFRKKYGSSY